MGKYIYKYPRPAVAVDVVAMCVADGLLQVLLIRRRCRPFKGCWALPGGFMEIDESPLAAAKRELAEETHLTAKPVLLEQIGAFGDVDRDPRGRVVSVAYLAVYGSKPRNLAADDDAESLEWFDVSALPALAFDHSDIMASALAVLREKARSSRVAFNLAGKEFTIEQLRAVFQILLDKTVDKRRFSQMILVEGLMKPVGRRGPAGQVYRLRPGVGRKALTLGI